MSLFPIERLPHLSIPQAPNRPERYKRRGFGSSRPQSGEREEVAQNFEVAFERFEKEQQAKAIDLPAGINPHLVFRMPLFPNVNIAELEEKLDRAGLTVVSIDADKTAVVAFRSDNDLSQFREAIETYKAPREGAKSTVFDVLEWVQAEEMRSWGPRDRIGPQLAEIIGSNGENIEEDRLYLPLDVELWARGNSAQEARQDLEEISSLINSGEDSARRDKRVLDTYAGATLCQARVKLKGARLRQLLNMDIVASVDFPPQPEISRGEVLSRTADDFPPSTKVSENGPRLCVLDTGIVSNHPLLQANVGYEEAFLTATSTVADQSGHGTRVAGIAVYGDILRCIENKNFESPIILYSGRILNEENELDEEKLFINQIRAALETFTKPPYECRIYNLSFGRREAWTPGKQTLWAEALDRLAREYRVLFVVSSGNVTTLKTMPCSDGTAEKIFARYHGCLLEDEWRLCDPATSALALTVGAIAEHDTPELDRDIKKAFAAKNQPSPFSRSGPGVRDAVKPDFTDSGGNLLFQGFGNIGQIRSEPSVSVVSLSRELSQHLFSFDIGTSLAAPRVARIAALTEWQLWQDIGERPHPNLVRAVMATAATIPEEARQLFDTDDIYRVCGYGRVDEVNAQYSRANRVLLCADAEVELDHFAIFRVPVPDELLQASGEKRITIALAFDPPVRARRNDYLGVEMGFKLVRGKSLDEVEDAYRKFTEQERKNNKNREPIPDTFLAELTPHDSMQKAGISRKHSTLQCATYSWSARNFGERYGQYEEWYIVVRSEKKWVTTAELERQSFAIAVAVEADNDDLYNAIRERVQIQPRTQVRV